MSNQGVQVVTVASGDVRLAREAWERYRHLDGLIRKPSHGDSTFQDKILRDLWLAVRAAAGQTRTDATQVNQEKKEDTTT